MAKLSMMCLLNPMTETEEEALPSKPLMRNCFDRFISTEATTNLTDTLNCESEVTKPQRRSGNVLISDWDFAFRSTSCKEATADDSKAVSKLPEATWDTADKATLPELRLLSVDVFEDLPQLEEIPEVEQGDYLPSKLVRADRTALYDDNDDIIERAGFASSSTATLPASNTHRIES